MSGKRAAEACCACGGGKASTDDYAPPPSSYDYAPPDLPQPPLLPPRDPLLPPPPTPMPPPPSPSLPPSSPPPSSPSSEPPFVIWSGEWWSKVAWVSVRRFFSGESHGDMRWVAVGGTVGLATLFAVGCCVICRRRSKARGRSRVAKNKQHLCGLLHYTCPYNYVPQARRSAARTEAIFQPWASSSPRAPSSRLSASSPRGLQLGAPQAGPLRQASRLEV